MIMSNEDAKLLLTSFKLRFIDKVFNTISESIRENVSETGLSKFNTPKFPIYTDILEENKFNKLNTEDIQLILDTVDGVGYDIIPVSETDIDGKSLYVYFTINIK